MFVLCLNKKEKKIENSKLNAELDLSRFRGHLALLSQSVLNITNLFVIKYAWFMIVIKHPHDETGLVQKFNQSSRYVYNFFIRSTTKRIRTCTAVDRIVIH